jgi:hypothetical protein
MLAQYSSGAAPAGDVGAHFQQVAQAVESGTLAQGIAAAMRSSDTAPFAQLVSQLFASGTAGQKTATLNALLAAVPPAQRVELSALVPGLGAASSVTDAQVAAVPAAAVEAIARHAEQHDGGIVEKMSAVYAAHPALVATLGSAAMMVAMRAMSGRTS